MIIIIPLTQYNHMTILNVVCAYVNLHLFLQNPDIRSRFEKNLGEKCPLECEQKYWEVDLLSAEVEKKVNITFFPLLQGACLIPSSIPFSFLHPQAERIKYKRPTIVYFLGLTKPLPLYE